MSWLVLVVSAAFEAVWVVALDRSEGFSKLIPVLIFFAALLVSMGGLAFALRELPTGTAYAVWVGIGAAVTIIYAMFTGAESVSLIKIALITGLIGCVIGLKLVSEV